METRGFIAVASSGFSKEGDNAAFKGVAGRFSKLLILTRELCHKSLYCHWKYSSGELGGLHALFEQQYQSLRKAAHVISERIGSLGAVPPEAYALTPPWKMEDNSACLSLEMIPVLINDHHGCAFEAKNVLEAADISADEVSAHIALQRLMEHENTARLLSTLTGSDGKHITHCVM